MIDFANPETLSQAVWVMAVGYIIIIIYEVYTLYLNKKQADIGKKVDKTNQHLNDINITLRQLHLELQEGKHGSKD